MEDYDLFEEENFNIYGSAEPEMETEESKDWQWTLIAVIVVVLIILLYFSESFKTLKIAPLPTSNLPYTAGASMRYASVDTATNRGESMY